MLHRDEEFCRALRLEVWRPLKDTGELGAALRTPWSGGFGDGLFCVAQAAQARLERGGPSLLAWLPSRPHLLWNCPSTRDLVAGLRPPANRLQERLLACLGPDHLILESLVEALEVKLAPGVPVFVATNNSLVDTVAAWAVALDSDQAFSQTVARQHRLVALQRCYSPVVRCT